MIKIFHILIIFHVLSLSCYFAPDIDNFNGDEWQRSLEMCNEYRLKSAERLKDQEEKLFSRNQNEIVALLGKPPVHELYDRNQKFFFYPLNCQDSLRLSIRFDALGRVSEVQIIRH